MKSRLVSMKGVLLITLVLIFALQSGAMAQDPVKVAPDKCKVLLENDRARVLDFWLKPGDKLAMHSHPASIIYVLAGGKIKTTLPDGKSTETEFKTGQTTWSEAVTHANENVGTTEAHVLVIELKEPPKEQKK
jgi:quercetin dioxygenase-like cupin family protein